MTDFYEKFSMSKYASQMDRQNDIAQDWQRQQEEIATLRRKLQAAEVCYKDALDRSVAAEQKLTFLEDGMTWAYSKIQHATFSKMDDTLMADAIKLYLEHGVTS